MECSTIRLVLVGMLVLIAVTLFMGLVTAGKVTDDALSDVNRNFIKDSNDTYWIVGVKGTDLYLYNSTDFNSSTWTATNLSIAGGSYDYPWIFEDGNETLRVIAVDILYSPDVYQEWNSTNLGTTWNGPKNVTEVAEGSFGLYQPIPYEILEDSGRFFFPYYMIDKSEAVLIFNSTDGLWYNNTINETNHGGSAYHITHFADSGTMYVFYKVANNPTNKVMYSVSTDNGTTWNEQIIINEASIDYGVDVVKNSTGLVAFFSDNANELSIQYCESSCETNTSWSSKKIIEAGSFFTYGGSEIYLNETMTTIAKFSFENNDLKEWHYNSSGWTFIGNVSDTPGWNDAPYGIQLRRYDNDLLGVYVTGADGDNEIWTYERDITLPSFLIQNSTYTANILETNISNYSIQFKYDSSLIDRVWAGYNFNSTYLNGTPLSSTTDNVTTFEVYNKNIGYTTTYPYDNMTHYWNFTIEYNNGTNSTQNSSSYSQGRWDFWINPLLYTYILFNISVVDEETRAPINATIQVTFDAFITDESLNLTNASSKDVNVITGSQTYGVVPIWANNLTTDGNFLVNSSGYDTEAYYLNNASVFNNSINNITIYMTNSTTSSSIYVHLIDEYWNDVTDAIVKALRYYPGTNEYITVEMAKTDDNGYALFHLIEEDIDYKFIVENETTGSVLHTTSPMRILCLETPCILDIILPPTTSLWETWNITGLEYQLYYNNDTSCVILTWDDTSGNTPTIRLFVEKQSTKNPLVLCNGTTTSTAGTLSCNLSNQTTGDFQVQAYYSTSPPKIIDSMWVWLETTFATFGNEGLIMGFFLVITMILIGLFNPVVGILLGIFGIIILAILKFVAIPWIVIVCFIAVGLIIIHKLRT